MFKKNGVLKIFFGIILIGIIFVGVFSFGNIGKQYSREAYVELNTGEKIVLNDTWGHKWDWTIKETEEQEIKSLTKGEKVVLTFDVNNTIDFANDDILIKIKKK